MPLLNFNLAGRSTTGRTKIWFVVYGNEIVGRVKWFAAWRWYVFFPVENTHHSASCLREIADFCESQSRGNKE